MLGVDDFTVHARRGQFHVLDKTAAAGVKHIILPVPTKLSKGKICTPTIHGNWLIGPTAENLDDKTAYQTTQEGLDEIVKGVQKLVPAVNPREAITQYSGLRPTRTPDGYAIRNFEHIAGYLEISGIRSTGVTASLSIARYVCDKLSEMGVSQEQKKEFIPKRNAIPCFREADDEQRNALIAENPLYGKVICRCETVTEAEIREAIKRVPGARDIDGVKRRLRAGLGRCQGGFCGMRIPQIIADELNIPVENVTKKGENSAILMGSTKQLRGEQ
jgi:glycerol-3-phosphate dehydrogenase